MCRHAFYHHNFVLTLYKTSPFINNKLFIKIIQYYVKTCFQICFEYLKKKPFIKKSVEQSKNKECKKRYHEKSPSTSIAYDSLILELSISINISTALLSWR